MNVWHLSGAKLLLHSTLHGGSPANAHVTWPCNAECSAVRLYEGSTVREYNAPVPPHLQGYKRLAVITPMYSRVRVGNHECIMQVYSDVSVT